MDFREITEFFKDTLKYIIVIVVVLVIVLYVVTLQQVVGPSMQPTLNEGDVLILNKFQYYIFDIKRNDVVSLKYDGSKYLIKRVIGLPGEKVSYKDNELYINDKYVDEYFLNGQETYDFDLEELGYDKIPKGYYFVMGDNRDNSTDSRIIGLVPAYEIEGTTNFAIFPFDRFGNFNE